MTDEASDSGLSLTRRRVLATTGTGGTVGLAGCLSDPCQLTLDKSLDGQLHYGQQATYVFEVCSDDDTFFDTAGQCNETITIIDDLPSGISFVSVSGSGGGTWMSTVSGNTVELTNDSYGDIGDGTPSECLTAEMTVQVDTADQFSGPAPHDVENCADLEYDGEEYRTDCVTNTITHDDCDLSFEKEITDEFQYGQEATYVYEACNEGETTCTGTMAIEDDLPDGISFVSASGTWSASVSGGVVTATNDSYGGLDPGECLTLEVVVQVAPAEEFPDDPPVQNCATLSHEGEQVTEDCVTHDITQTACTLSLSKETGGEFHYGEQATYTYEVCNEQEEACDAPLTVEDDLPDGISFVSASGNWTATASGGVVEATNSSYGSLAPGDCLTLDLTVDVASADQFSGDPPHEVENCAMLRQNGEATDEDCVTHPVTAAGECELSLSKSTTGEFVAGEQHQAGYVYEVCNEGDAECSGTLDISDPLPDGISGPVQLGSGLTGPVTGGTFQGTIQYSGLAPGDCLTRELLVTVGDAAAFSGDPPHEVENCATLSHEGQSVAEDCVSHDVTVDTGGGPCPPVAFDLNSGWDQDGAATLGDGTSDDDWTVTADSSNTLPVPAQATVVNGSDIPGNWPAPFPDTRWISHTADAQQPSDFISYEYEYCFCLREGFENPVLDLRIQADNRINDLRLNGTSLSFLVNGSFQGAPLDRTYDDPSLFQAGENCLTLVVGSRYEQIAVNVEGTVTADNADCDCTPCDPTLSKEVVGEFTYGGQGRYRFTVCNEGEGECTEPFDVVDDLPDGISFVSASGDWTGSVSGGEVTVTNDSYGSLAPGDCIEFEMVVDVASEDEFPGDPPQEVENCARLQQGGDVVAEDCVIHDIVPGEDPCPPVAVDLNTGYDQASGATLGDGDDDDDWELVVDSSGSGPVPRSATVVNQSDSPGNWPAPFTDSRWVSHAADPAYSPPPNSTYEYEYCFCLRDGFENPELALQIRADNTVVDIRLNDSPLPFSGDGSFQNAPIDESYTDPDIFRAGENCLTLVLQNELNQTGLNVAGTMSADNADCDCTDCSPTLSKEAAGEFHYNQQGSYRVTVCNEGEGECVGPFAVVDDLPDGLSFVSAGGDWTGSVSGGTVTVTNNSYGSLAPGDCIEFEMVVDIASADAFPGDSLGSTEVENCATLLQNSEPTDEDCARHDVTLPRDEEPEPDPSP